MELDEFLKLKLALLEKTHTYEVSTDTVRCWIDEYETIVQ